MVVAVTPTVDAPKVGLLLAVIVPKVARSAASSVLRPTLTAACVALVDRAGMAAPVDPVVIAATVALAAPSASTTPQ